MQNQPANPVDTQKPVPEPALFVQDLQFRTGFTTLLRNIHFELAQGEVLLLIGPNGAGKSTLLKCLAGLLPHQGSKYILGATLKRNYALKQRLGYLGHETFLYMKLSARENLQFYASLYGIHVDAEAILAEYQLSEAGEQMVETFSRGMKQRLALARALIQKPDLLLLDEPFTGLDQQAVRMLESRIAKLKGLTAFVITTHELEQGFQLCDKLLILKGGKQVFYGSKSEVDGDIRDFYRAKTI